MIWGKFDTASERCSHIAPREHPAFCPSGVRPELLLQQKGKQPQPLLTSRYCLMESTRLYYDTARNLSAASGTFFFRVRILFVERERNLEDGHASLRARPVGR